MRYVRNTILTILVVAFALLLYYVLPRHDVARITGTEIIRMDFSALNRPFYAQTDSANTDMPTRDVRLINTVKKRSWFFGFIPRDSERVFVFRNEDTGWIWPPYFKFDSSDLQAQAAANVSTNANPQWAVLTHYGWRNKYLSIYPNAIGIRPVEGPDVTVIPWFNIVFFFFLAIAWGFLRAVWRQFRERTIDPTMDDIEEQWDTVGHHLSERRGRFRRWLDTWRAKK